MEYIFVYLLLDTQEIYISTVGKWVEEYAISWRVEL
jgi:hypothetical protein